jgi:hypothetical protein
MNPPRITVTRVESQWLAEVHDLDRVHRVRTLYQLDRWVRCTFRPGWIAYRFRMGDPHLDRLITRARESRREARRADERARDLTLQVLAAADHAGLSGRDLGVLLGMSHQRIHQLQRDLGL